MSEVLLGAVPGDAGCRFTVWAPGASRVTVVTEPTEGGDRAAATGLTAPSAPPAPLGLEALTVGTPLERGDGGYWTGVVPGVMADAAYGFVLHDDDEGRAGPLPDPASRHQPWGVHGPSAVVDTSRFRWTDRGWRGVELADVVYYELHIGTFTPAGTLAAAAGELPRLAALGVTMVELMPVNAFPGVRGWGYDGVFPSAVHHPYGGPEALAAFVDAAHGLGIGVTLDVVYNHLGPEGNVLGRYGPYFTDRYRTPWGAAVNFSEAGSDGVRHLFLDSASRWISEFHVDGLRVDAVHAILDPTAVTFTEELVAAVHGAAAAAGRTVVVTAESADNDPRLIRPAEAGGIGFDAVWNDDFHHALRVALTADTGGYYADFASGAADLAEAYRHGFVQRGRPSAYRGRRHGRPLPPDAEPARLVVFGQNHDQVGNRQEGERLDTYLSAGQRRLAAAAVLLSPFTPLLFMGEEYGETAPFPYFVDHGDPELLEAVRQGRAAEFEGFEWEGETPDPAAEATFASARLDPELRAQPAHRALEALYFELLTLRRQWPVLTGASGWPEVSDDEGLITLSYPVDDGRLLVTLNVTPSGRPVPGGADPVFSTEPDGGPGGRIAPWSAALWFAPDSPA
ncbi:MAG: malto-oligosyltrehalose trehalohydrolase [Acidimicrobiales bacterium]